jgi:acyl-CoA thioester hydrolase
VNDHFRFYFRVRFDECDPQMVVFNARYSDYLNIAGYEFMRAIGCASAGPRCAVARQLLEWSAPARFDQVIEARIWSPDQGQKSFDLETSFYLAGEELLLARAEVKYVLMLHRERVGVVMDDALRAALRQGARGCRTDHAGYFHARQTMRGEWASVVPAA